MTEDKGRFVCKLKEDLALIRDTKKGRAAPEDVARITRELREFAENTKLER